MALIHEGGKMYPDLSLIDIDRLISRIQMGYYDIDTLRALRYQAQKEEKYQSLLEICEEGITMAKKVKLAASKERKREAALLRSTSEEMEERTEELLSICSKPRENMISEEKGNEH